ncbi:MAG: ATP-binding cassette domain-containing protein [Chloroflexi bacterium]|nr:ATP-binding cassette domain-containing protein [Chloroflexota bacterium]MCY3938074.1 ATP-binding cassette domain-containing protein [Chloroflexota bacterium]
MIVFQDVCKQYRDDEWALHNVTLTIPRNEFVFLVGPNGAGKSTLLRLVTTEERPTKGIILVGGIDISHPKNGTLPKYRRSIGIVFQDTRLFGNQTVFDNVALPLKIAGESGRVIRERSLECLETAGVRNLAYRKAGELSGGELRRVAIARAIVSEPNILLADEPTDSLSPSAATDVMDLLMEISRNGVTTIVATHHREVVDRLRRRVIRLDRGRITNDLPAAGFDD